MSQATLFNNQLNNTGTILGQQAGIENQKFTAKSTALNGINQVYLQLLNGAYQKLQGQDTALRNKYQINDDVWTKGLDAVYKNSQMNFERYRLAKEVSDTARANALSEADFNYRTNSLKATWASNSAQIYDMLVRNATAPISATAAAQEAAQQPALRLWNASTGLNQAATGVLVAISNQGTRTQTTHQEGNFLGGLFGGVATGFAGGWGSAAGNALFGKQS